MFLLHGEAALLCIMALSVPVSSVRCFASLSHRFFLCCLFPWVFVGCSSNFDITPLIAADIAAVMLIWNLSKNFFLSNWLSTASLDELSSSSLDSGASEFAVGTKCAYFVKKGISSSLSVSCQGDVFTSPGSSIVSLLSVFL